MSRRLYLTVVVSHDEADAIAAAVPSLGPVVASARHEALLLDCGVHRNFDGTVEMPATLAVVWALALFMRTGALPELAGLEISMAEDPTVLLRWASWQFGARP